MGKETGGRNSIRKRKASPETAGHNGEEIYIASWSGGKDSTATIILAHENNEPLDIIVFCEVMFDKETTGELPEKIHFVKNIAKPMFESWGYKVLILHHTKTFMDEFEHTRGEKSKWSGMKLGFPMAGKCYMNDAKRKPIQKFYRQLERENKKYKDYVGIAVDEQERLEAMKTRNTNQISLLAKYGYTEQMAMQKCREYGLVSPIYKFSKRDGCWFCPNASPKQIKQVRDNHPELWKKMTELEERSQNGYIGQIFDTRGGRSIKSLELQFQQEDAQMTIFDFIGET